MKKCTSLSSTYCPAAIYTYVQKIKSYLEPSQKDAISTMKTLVSVKDEKHWTSSLALLNPRKNKYINE